MVRTLALALPLLLAVAARADAPFPPKGPPPTLTVVSMPKKDALITRELVKVPVAEERLEEVIIDGRKEVRKVLVTTYRVVPVERTLNLKGLQANEVDGTPIAMADLARRLAKPTIVALSADGDPVDPAFLSVLKKGTIVLRVPRPMAPPLKLPPPPAE
jgi:hypothetical protein